MLSTFLILAAATATSHSTESDRQAVAALDTEFQLATKNNDVATIERILHPNYKLVLGNGKTFDRAYLVEEARTRAAEFELQEEVPGTQTVMVEGDTAIVTAKLLYKGIRKEKPFDLVLWFSDTYVRTPDGWRYLFGQASLPLPAK